MKFSKKILAAVLCAAMLCVPALAAGSSNAPGAGTYVPDSQYTMVWGTAARQADGSLLVQKPGETQPTDGYIFWLKDTMVLDAVTGEPADISTIKNGDTVYAWMGARSVMTMSLPPQTTPELLLVNIPADFQVPQYDIIARANYIMKGIPGYSGMAITLSDGTACQVWQDATVTPYLTRNRVTYQDLLPGARVLVWTDDKGQASKVIVFPYEYKGGLSLGDSGFLCVNGYLTVYPPALRRPYNDERLYAPIRAVAEAAGYSVSWDNEFGVTVKDGSDILFQICPDTKLAHGPAAADRHSLAGPCLIADGVTYLEVHDLARLLGMFYGG